VTPPNADEVTDTAIPAIIDAMATGWWGDSALAKALARRPESLKATVALVETLYTKSGIDPVLLELMRITVAEARDDTYGSVIRVQPFADAVARKRSAQALTEPEAVALELAQRMALNPHTVDDTLYGQLKEHFTDEQAVAVVFAISVFSMASGIQIGLHLDTEPGGDYPTALVYRQEHLKS
jgi:alkylhydroperoxidase family enzyme